MTIKRRLLRILLGICLLSFALVSILSIYGGWRTEREVERMGENLGYSLTHSVEEMMEIHDRYQIFEMIQWRASHFDMVLHQFHQDLEIITDMAQNILEHPENYEGKTLYNPSTRAEGYILATKLAPNVYNGNLRENIAMAANLQDILVAVAKSYNFDISVYTAFENGVDIYVDTSDADFKELHGKNPNVEYVELDFLHRPWYEKAKAEGKNTITDVFMNSADYDRKLSIVSATPIMADEKFAGVAGIGFSVDSISDVVLKTSVGKTGFAFVINSKGQVLISPKKDGPLSVKENAPDLRQSHNKSLADAVKLLTRGATAVLPVNIEGKEYYLAFAPLKHIDWSFCAIIEVDEVHEPARDIEKNLFAYMNNYIDSINGVFIGIIPLMVFFLIILLGIVITLSTRFSERFVRPIRKLSEGVRDVAMGNFDHKLEIIKTGDEIESLSTTFNAMTDDLQKYIQELKTVTAEKERIAAELDVAKSIQQSMLPREFLPFPDKTEFDIYATMEAAKSVGGDFYDFYLADENHLVVTIADVSGKGIPAALFMMRAKTILKNFVLMANTADDLAAAMTLANQQLCQDNDELMFVTVFLAMLDLKTGKLIYVNAAHNPPLTLHDGKYTYFSKNIKKVPPLGVRSKTTYEQHELQMTEGDIVFLYTDGVTEAENVEKKLYSNERLEEFLNGTDKNLTLEELLAQVRQSIKNHAGEAQQSDDITMLALRFKG
ncbi:MAG: SpoIIE family protein phosphatase [Selenomonadaceae bacterium]|nr:SpoIIE family protein phosphatase [Selenomonadaceae bacterium]